MVKTSSVGPFQIDWADDVEDMDYEPWNPDQVNVEAMKNDYDTILAQHCIISDAKAQHQQPEFKVTPAKWPRRVSMTPTPWQLQLPPFRSINNDSPNKVTSIINSGASSHFFIIDKEVTVGGGTSVSIVGQGTVSLINSQGEQVLLQEAYHVLEFESNFVSKSALCEKGCVATDDKKADLVPCGSSTPTGMIQVEAIGGYRKFLVLVEDSSSAISAYLQQGNDEVCDNIQDFAKRMTNQGIKITEFRSDNGTEFTNKK
ncbi:UNVERIFIED_CONTAM: hypothetical protein HDU68_008730 [Siphonaria sp. JEL0065]|nr:hypothetical protein HDU68_008730 [Siphonaria sp. JEL0065]